MHPSRQRFPEPAALSIGLSALLGLVLALVIYPPAFLMGNAARFHNFVFPNDALDYRLAWQALVDRGRPWPSLWTDLFNYPDGFPISLMDGLPLAATVFLEAPARIGVASHLHPVGLVEQRHLHAPDSTSESTAGPRSALIQPSPAGLTSSRMRASVNILRSPTSATMENPKRRLGGAV